MYKPSKLRHVLDHAMDAAEDAFGRGSVLGTIVGGLIGLITRPGTPAIQYLTEVVAIAAFSALIGGMIAYIIVFTATI